MNKNYMIDAIIVDDELNGIHNLRYYINRYCPELKIVGTAATLPDARELILQGGFQVAFLDIEFCETTIFDILQELQQPSFSIVFVTAYDRYAVKAFKVEALDYLLKPLSQQDIVQCFQKISRHFGDGKTLPTPVAEAMKQPDVSRKVILRDREHVFILQQADILYLKAMGAYTEVTFFFQQRIYTVMVSKTLSVLEKEYHADFFFRVHKSYLINLKQVTGIRKHDIPMVEMTDNNNIPIAKRRMHDLFICLKEME